MTAGAVEERAGNCGFHPHSAVASNQEPQAEHPLASSPKLPKHNEQVSFSQRPTVNASRHHLDHLPREKMIISVEKQSFASDCPAFTTLANGDACTFTRDGLAEGRHSSSFMALIYHDIQAVQ